MPRIVDLVSVCCLFGVIDWVESGLFRLNLGCLLKLDEVARLTKTMMK